MDETSHNDQTKDQQVKASVYPPGFEPELEGEELEAAIRKEKRYGWMVRFELAGLLLIFIVVMVFIFGPR